MEVLQDIHEIQHREEAEALGKRKKLTKPWKLVVNKLTFLINYLIIVKFLNHGENGQALFSSFPDKNDINTLKLTFQSRLSTRNQNI